MNSCSMQETLNTSKKNLPVFKNVFFPFYLREPEASWLSRFVFKCHRNRVRVPSLHNLFVFCPRCNQLANVLLSQVSHLNLIFSAFGDICSSYINRPVDPNLQFLNALICFIGQFRLSSVGRYFITPYYFSLFKQSITNQSP